MDPRYKRLVETVRDRTGPALRGVVAYQGDETALLYRRDDLDSSATDRLQTTLTAAKERRPLLDGAGEDDRQASVHLFDDAVVVHLPEPGSRGTLVSLDAGVARQLSGFVEECTVAMRSPESGADADSAHADD